MTHLDDLLSAHLDGELDSDEEARVRSHLDACTDCRQELNDITKARNLVRSLPLIDPPPGLLPETAAGQRKPSWLANPGWVGAMSAAAVVIVAVGGFLVLQDDGGPDSAAMATVPRSITGVAAAIPAGDPDMTDRERQAVVESTVDDMGMDMFSDPVAPMGFVHHGDPIAVRAGLFNEVVDNEEASRGLEQMYEDELVFGLGSGPVVFFCDHSWYRLWTLGDGIDPMDAAMDLKAGLGCRGQ
ncbi:MAG: zf-HC2 domain-containing protein [Acidimicrobiia bacterium]|nr:zf-HC2 domain-containing protein [Acidimicrobiia bacterium]